MATNEVQTVNTTADKAKLAVAATAVVASFVAYYALSKQGPLFQWLGLLAGLAVAVLVFLTSESGRRWSLFSRMRCVRCAKWCGLHAVRRSK